MGYDETVFQNPERAADGDLIVATYYLETAASDLVRKAGEIAIGQTTGGWIGLPRADRAVLERVVGRVLAVWELPPAETRREPDAAGLRRAVVRLGFPIENVGSDLAALLVAVYGKVSLDGALKLLDLDIPERLARRLPGPAVGIAGVRNLVGREAGRPLLMSIFKPALGLDAAVLAEMLFEQGLGGMDLVKDDEVLADEVFDTALRRLELCLEACEQSRKETGRPLLYALSLTGPADELQRRARQLCRAGASCLLFNALAYGLPALAALARDPEVTAALMAHPALAGGLVLEPTHGIAAHVLLGKLGRLAGADLALFPSPYGSVALRRESALKIAFSLTRPLHGLAPSFPVPSAGITPALVPQLLADYGNDVVINAGGAVHGHPAGARAGAEAFAAALEASLQGVPLSAAAEASPALKRALEVDRC